MIEASHFSLDPGIHWLELSTDDPDAYSLIDENREISATLSSLALRADPAALEDFAHIFADMRVQAEADAGRMFGRIATIYEPIVAPQPWGQALAYYGHDDSGRQFSFSGIVRPGSVISLHMSSTRLGEAKLAMAMDEVLTRIAFDRTPLLREHCIV
jgi:hypothetical protein